MASPLATSMDRRYDVIVVGGGSAGCVAAARLSEDPTRKVLLLEAGPDPRPIPDLIADAAKQIRLLLESPYLIMYPTERNADRSVFHNLAGRIMGGGSSVNVMSALRPTKFDFDQWVGQGDSGWSYETMLPVLKRIETDHDYPDSPLHGHDGPLHVLRPFRFDMPMSPPVRAFIERAGSMGLPLCPDINIADPSGICLAPYNIMNGKRQSTVVAYLDRARSRLNLDVIAEAQVLSLMVAKTKVEGVRFQKNAEVHKAYGDQIVMAAGVYHTPQILMLSGIGPPAELQRHRIPVVHALEGVGDNYQDHATVCMTFEGKEDFQADWIIPRFRLLIQCNSAGNCGNFHIIMRPPATVHGVKRMMPISANLLEQRTRGRIFLKSSDPHELPGIDPKMLEHPEDVRAVVSAMEFIAELVEKEPAKAFYGPLIQPRPEQDWGEFASRTYESYHHGVGTCKMGLAADPTAVVDERLRVHGLSNLWIGDASIVPTVPHANTNLTAIMIGERLSDFIGESG